LVALEVNLSLITIFPLVSFSFFLRSLILPI
jgi:hypothetical protein